MDLESLVACYLPKIELTLRDVLGSDHTEDSDYARMMHYHMGWDDQNQAPATSGKRTRPLLTLLCAAASGGDWQLALPLAAGVELIHNFSLIHDDIQDSSRMRHNRPTVWALWGQNQAINAGDALFTYAHLAVQKAAGLEAETRLEAIRLIDETCIALTIGQHIDMGFETHHSVTIEDYMTMISGKTAALIAASADLGALASGTPKYVRRHYRDFGNALGIAFQIRDDVLGIWGDAATTGKSVTTDIESGKKTLPVIYALQQSPELRQAYKTQDMGRVDAHFVKRILDETGARGYSEGEEHRHMEQALRHLNEAHPQGDAGAGLREMTVQLLGRSK